jgi:transposase
VLEAVWSRKLPDWIAAHARAFAYFGGAARLSQSELIRTSVMYSPGLRHLTPEPADHRPVASTAAQRI